MKERILLVGGRSKAKSLAESLHHRGYRVTLLNKSSTDCEQLSQLDGVCVLEGDGTKPYVLEDSEIENFSTVIALTPRDADNLLICELAKQQFNVKKTVALLSDAKKKDFFLQMGVDCVVSVSNSIRSLIEQEALLTEIEDSLPSLHNRPLILELRVGKASPLQNKHLWEITLPPQTNVTCILRDAYHIIPNGDTQLFEGDQVILITQPEHSLTLQKLFGTKAKSAFLE